MAHKSYSTGFGSVPNSTAHAPQASETNGHLYIANDNLKRIADALDTIIDMIKKDQEESKKRWEEKDE